MSNKLSTLLLSILATLLFNCSSNSNQSNAEATVDSTDVEAEPDTVVEMVVSPAVCIWDDLWVRKDPGGKKMVTKLSVGESLKYLGADSVIGEKTYAKVQLNDENEGWTLKDFIVVDAKPAVILSNISLYSRPDLLTKSDKSFEMMDIVASIETQGDWMKIKGKLGTWMSEGWVKSDNVSFETIDIAGAKFAKEALQIEDEEERKNAINEVIDNTDLSGSRFITELESHLQEILDAQMPEPEIQELEVQVEDLDSTSVQ